MQTAAIQRDALARAVRDLVSFSPGEEGSAHLVSELCTRASGVVGAASCGVLLANDQKRLEHVAASDEEARALTLLQVRCVQGPCLDAFDAGETIVVRDLRDHADRWPEYVMRLQHRDVRGLMALPMRAGEQTIGSLQAMSRAPGAFTSDDVLAVEALTAVATDRMVRTRALDATQQTVDQLQRALHSRVLIEQAKGVLAERAGLSVSAAFEHLRHHARSNQRRLDDVCEDVIAGRIDTGALRSTALPVANSQLSPS